MASYYADILKALVSHCRRCTVIITTIISPLRLFLVSLTMTRK